MSKRKQRNRAILFDEATIHKMLACDSIALGELVARKMNYVKTIIQSYADSKDVWIDDQTKDDLAEMVWLKFFTKKEKLMAKFH